MIMFNNNSSIHHDSQNYLARVKYALRFSFFFSSHFSKALNHSVLSYWSSKNRNVNVFQYENLTDTIIVDKYASVSRSFEHVCKVKGNDVEIFWTCFSTSVMVFTYCNGSNVCYAWQERSNYFTSTLEP